MLLIVALLRLKIMILIQVIYPLSSFIKYKILDLESLVVIPASKSACD
jgi:hypothetical protein